MDLREELKEKNRSIFSRKLKCLMEDKLSRKEQIMIFINRRGFQVLYPVEAVVML